jgi:acyl-CoA reductase-like NAD-dependent aldehyde dehydrogenase
MATDRILVHKALAQEFIDAMKARLENTMADGSPLPVVASAASKSRLQKVVA